MNNQLNNLRETVFVAELRHQWEQLEGELVELTLALNVAIEKEKRIRILYIAKQFLHEHVWQLLCKLDQEFTYGDCSDFMLRHHNAVCASTKSNHLVEPTSTEKFSGFLRPGGQA